MLQENLKNLFGQPKVMYGEGNGNALQYSCLEGYSPWGRKSWTGDLRN